ncbi:uncharacterized protein EV420DRAFT_1749699 [Desarmillaria tabescens]|uniref:Uncharacterized protein n=1 Tax=Armillaria tabescens TaxID=1929756 RepID=A0AA39K603_ARMTA|nr:uncharacterized protein EV420DRAFT_1749699 [Desarmillaria tabescens]KAK0452878.1 hypothetical protein EV420DRAFT_1749699 [Desarmillaria tabescens]
MAPNRYTITVQGKIYWRLVWEYDNSQNNGKITEKYTLEKLTSYTSSTFRQDVSSETKKAIERGEIKSEAGVSYGPVSASVSAEYESSKEINDLMESTTKNQTDETYETKSTFERSFEIGPYSKLILYQQWFSAAGVDLKSDVVSTNPDRGSEVKIVDIDVVIEEQEFIKDVKVVYSDQPSGKPEERVREYSGGNDDINAGFKGKYVSLVPVYTYDIREAATFFDVIIQSSAWAGHDDLAKDAGGDYRYLVPVKDERNSKKIYQLALFRSSKYSTREHIRSLGYDDMTSDINENRGGDYLYLIWKSKIAYATV